MSTANPKSTPNRNYHLDLIRGIAALVVLADHTHGELFVPKEQAHGLTRVFYLDHYCGGAAVMLFFLLSGYLVGTSVLKSVRRDRWSWSNYLVNRGSRLWVALLPALAWTFALDNLARRIVGQSGSWFAAPDTLPNLLGSTFFLQDIFVKPFGSDGSLWSLSYEFWFYILFPPLVLLIGRRRRIWADVLLLAVTATLVGWGILYLFPCWILGVLVGMTAENRPTLARPTAALLAVGSVLALIGLMFAEGLHFLPLFDRYQKQVSFYADALLAIPLLWVALRAPAPNSRLYRGVAVFFSEMSYTLYLTHQPVLAFFKTVWMKGRLWPSDWRHLAMTLPIFCVTVVISYGLYWLFESRTDKVRAFLKSRLLDRQPNPVTV